MGTVDRQLINSRDSSQAWRLESLRPRHQICCLVKAYFVGESFFPYPHMAEGDKGVLWGPFHEGFNPIREDCILNYLSGLGFSV